MKIYPSSTTADCRTSTYARKTSATAAYPTVTRPRTAADQRSCWTCSDRLRCPWTLRDTFGAQTVAKSPHPPLIPVEEPVDSRRPRRLPKQDYPHPPLILVEKPIGMRGAPPFPKRKFREAHFLVETAGLPPTHESVLRRYDRISLDAASSLARTASDSSRVAPLEKR